MKGDQYIWIGVILLGIFLITLVSLSQTPSGMIVVQLNVNENIGDEYKVLSEQSWTSLPSSLIRTREGNTAVNQYILFNDPGASDAIESCTVKSTKNTKGVVGAFLHCVRGDDIFEYKLVFTQGLKGVVKKNNIDDLNGIRINILGQEYTISEVKLRGKSITLALAGGSTTELLKEGTSRTLAMHGVDYDVKVLIITDEAIPKVVFEVNGQRTKALKKGEIEWVGALPIAVLNILPNEGGETRFSGDLVEVAYGGASRLVLADSDFTDGNYDTGGATIDNVYIPESRVNIVATETDSIVTISSINYRLTAASKDNDDIYVDPGMSMTSYVKHPSAFLSSKWDIQFGGSDVKVIDEVQTSQIIFDSSGDGYRLKFKTTGGRQYSVPLLYNNGGTLKYGTDSHDLLYTEGNTITNYNIKSKDTFILNDRDDGKGRTHILRFDGVQGMSAVFTDLSGGITNVPLTGAFINIFNDFFSMGNIRVPLTGMVVAGGSFGNLIVSGSSYKVYTNEQNDKVVIDLNGDGTFDGASVDINVLGNGIIELGKGGLTLDIKLKTPHRYMRDQTTDESNTIRFTASNGGVGVSLPNTNTDFDKSLKQDKGITPYGTQFILEKGTSNNDLTIKYPLSQGNG